MYTIFLHTNNIPYPFNSRFKKGDVAVNQMLYITNKIYQYVESGLSFILIFLDFKSAFDSLWHSGLIFKMRSIEIHGQLLQWFTSYLKNRKQTVVLNGITSDEQMIKCGVPQGSVLGPLLFLLYVNDLCNDTSQRDIYLQTM